MFKLYLRYCLLFFTAAVAFSGNASSSDLSGINDSLVTFHGQVKSQTGDIDLTHISNRNAILRHVNAELNESFTRDFFGKAQAGDTVLLNLFPDVHYRARVENVHSNINGSFIVRASVFEPVNGSFIISTTGGRSLLTVLLNKGDLIYRLVSVPESSEHIMLEMDKSLMDEINACHEMVPPPPSDEEKAEQEKLKKRAGEKSKGDKATIDVMIVYTPAAREWARINEGGIENSIAVSMELAQISAENSDLGLSFRLVHSRLVQYTEGDSAQTDLRRLTAYPGFNPFGNNGAAIEGFMDEVHDLRDAYSADLVALFPRRYDSGGMAWQLTDRDGRPRFGFSLTRIQQASWTLTHAHELGHNMGAHHHKEQEDSPGPTEWDNWPGNNWSAGWRWTGVDNRVYVSVMAYQEAEQYDDGIPGQRVPYFSNPDVLHMESPTGNFTDGNNARTIKETKHVIAAYRTRSVYTLRASVFDIEGNPLKGARVEVKEQGLQLYTSADGSFEIPYLPEGWHNIVISKEGFYPLEERFLIEAGSTIEREFIMEEIVSQAISGYVAAMGHEADGIEGAIVSFSRSGKVFNTSTGNGGIFTLEDIPAGLPYSLLVTYPGYEVYRDTIVWSLEDDMLDNIYLGVSKRGVDRIFADQTDAYIEISWETPSFEGEFRHDRAGAPLTAIGFDNAANSVFGGAHRRHAWIRSVEWFSSSESEENVTLRILGLNDNGFPDKNNVLYWEEGVTNLPGNPRQYTLPETVYAPGGFFVGVGAEGSFYIAADDHDFRSGTNFFTSDYDRHAFTDMNSTDFRYNLFVRAYGFDFGPWLRDANLHKENSIVNTGGVSFELPEKSQPVSYNVYLDDLENPYDENITTNKYRFTGLPEGRYTAGVQAVYPEGVSDITTRTVFSGTPRYRLVLHVDPPDAGRVYTQGEYRKDYEVRLEAVPNSGYVFHRWLDKYMNEFTDSPYYSFSMPEEDMELTALFVEDPSGVDEIRIFPNPARERFTIISVNTIDQVRIYGITGNMVYSAKNIDSDYHHVAIGGIGQGIYIVQILTDGEWLSRRVQLMGAYR